MILAVNCGLYLDEIGRVEEAAPPLGHCVCSAAAAMAAAPVAESSGWTGPDWPSDEGDALLLAEGEDAERFKASVLGVCRLQHTSSEDYIAKEVKSTFGTHFRTLLGLRRLVCRLESPK